MLQPRSDVLKERLVSCLYFSVTFWRLAEVRHEFHASGCQPGSRETVVNWCLCSAFQCGSLCCRILRTPEKVSFLFAPCAKALKQVLASVSWTIKITSFPEYAKGHYVPLQKCPRGPHNLC